MTLARRLNHLFETVHPPGRGPWTLTEVANAINSSDGGVTISIGYLSELRAGRKTNPKIGHLEALARFFAVKPAYFFDDEYADAIDADLEDLVILRDSGVKQIARRSFELPDDAREAVSNFVDQIRKYNLGREPDEKADREPNGGTG